METELSIKNNQSKMSQIIQDSNGMYLSVLIRYNIFRKINKDMNLPIC